MELSGNLTEKQSTTLARNFDNASKDYQEHLAELDKKIIQVVDAALNQQLANWERKPPVPSESFKSIGKQLTKFHEDRRCKREFLENPFNYLEFI